MMLLMLVLGLLAWMTNAAVRVRYFETASHADRQDGFIKIHASPFWPRFWHRLIGGQILGAYRCPLGDPEAEDPEEDMRLRRETRVEWDRVFSRFPKSRGPQFPTAQPQGP
jgi:hypothetical protein